MPRFELEFERRAITEEGIEIGVPNCRRVIFAEDERNPFDDKESRKEKNEKLARAIAKAMSSGVVVSRGPVGIVEVGEEINSREYFSGVVSVSETEDEYTGYWDSGYSWGRVWREMGLEEEDVEFVYDESPFRIFIVGFRLTNQIANYKS